MIRQEIVPRWWACVLAVLIVTLLLDVVMANENERKYAEGKMKMILHLGALLGGGVLADTDGATRRASRPAPPHRPRKRRGIKSIFNEYGEYYCRRAYRMDQPSFWKLHAILEPVMNKRTKKRKHKQRKGAKNGIISTPIRLSVALRYFAGGRPDDIAISHGISHSEVFNSVWKVVDAVHKIDSMKIVYPGDHEVQKQIAAGFWRRSKAGFGVVAGTIDCMLIWIEKPTLFHCASASCGAGKFFCGRKHKYGMCLQAICDSDARFLDVDLGHPASTSDFMAFTASKIYKRLEDDASQVGSFLFPGLCLFGDAAYVNNKYMATPFGRVGGGSKDDFNFYHSQVCQFFFVSPLLYGFYSLNCQLSFVR